MLIEAFRVKCQDSYNFLSNNTIILINYIHFNTFKFLLDIIFNFQNHTYARVCVYIYI